MDTIFLNELGKQIIQDIAFSSEPIRTLVVLQSDISEMASQNTVSVGGKSDQLISAFVDTAQAVSKRAEAENAVLMVVCELTPASKFGVQMLVDDKKGQLWGFFIRSDQMETGTSRLYELSAWRIDPDTRKLSKRHAEPLHFQYSSVFSGMIPETNNTLHIEDPLVQQTIEAIVEDTNTFLKDVGTVSSMKKYVQDLFDATRKYLLTERDRNIFFDVLERESFHSTERDLRQKIWNVPAFRIDNFLTVIRQRIGEIESRKDVDGEALRMTLEVLIGFIGEMHHGSRVKKIKTVLNKVKEPRETSVRFNNQVQYMTPV